MEVVEFSFTLSAAEHDSALQALSKSRDRAFTIIGHLANLDSIQRRAFLVDTAINTIIDHPRLHSLSQIVP